MLNKLVADNAEFTIPSNLVDRNGNVRIATRNGSVFNSKSISLQVKGPGGNWYDTGVNFKEGGAQVVATREAVTYRFVSETDFAGTTLNFLFW